MRWNGTATMNSQGHKVRYYFNYSEAPQPVLYPHGAAVELLSGQEVQPQDSFTLEAWGVRILLERSSGADPEAGASGGI
jgi:beta-galactosidase